MNSRLARAEATVVSQGEVMENLRARVLHLEGRHATANGGPIHPVPFSAERAEPEPYLASLTARALRAGIPQGAAPATLGGAMHASVERRGRDDLRAPQAGQPGLVPGDSFLGKVPAFASPRPPPPAQATGILGETPRARPGLQLDEAMSRLREREGVQSSGGGPAHGEAPLPSGAGAGGPAGSHPDVAMVLERVERFQARAKELLG